jgi:hypothetical protein
VWACSTSGFSCGEFTTTPGINCSNLICAQDFENEIADDTGLVDIILPSDRIPTLAPGDHATVSNPTQFEWWFKVRSNRNQYWNNM